MQIESDVQIGIWTFISKAHAEHKKLQRMTGFLYTQAKSAWQVEICTQAYKRFFYTPVEVICMHV